MGIPQPAIGETEFADLLRSLAPVSENYLKRLLRDSGTPLAPMIAGVRQANLEELESSLLALLDEYERGDPPRRAAVRNLVITAKDHARWVSRRAEAASPESLPDATSPGLDAAPVSHERESNKPEMILWMITWLENPSVFREWVRLRKLQLRQAEPGA
jgi:hypothetical protein